MPTEPDRGPAMLFPAIRAAGSSLYGASLCCHKPYWFLRQNARSRTAETSGRSSAAALTFPLKYLPVQVEGQ